MDSSVARRRADVIYRKLTSLNWRRGQLINSIPLTNGVYARFERCKRQAWRAAHPSAKRMGVGKKFEQDSAVLAAAKAFRSNSDSMWSRWQAALRRWLSEAKQLAQDVPLRTTGEDQWVELASVSDSDYSSQGRGAGKYAKADVERHLQMVLAHLSVEYVRIESTASSLKYFDAWSHREVTTQRVKYRVLVRVEATDLCWLDWKPSPSLREIVKSLWKQGRQPRVLYPFLPYEYEQRNGLDYFGNDLPGWSAEVTAADATAEKSGTG